MSFKSAFSLSSFTFIKRLLSSSLLWAIRVVSSAYLSLSHSFLSYKTEMLISTTQDAVGRDQIK